jgi:deoxyadenosine/deoxycytidine kinase
MPRALLLAVAGMVGTGKSTLTAALATRFGLQTAFESVDADNPWLARFYGPEPDARARWALPLQLHFLATRFRDLRRLRARGGGWILDRTWYEDAEVFARGHFEHGLLTADEWALYAQLYAELLTGPAARPPRLLVYLHAPLEVIQARIHERGRPSEREVPLAYWAQLHARYAAWIAGFRRCPVLTLDVRDYDLKGDPDAAEVIARAVRQRLEPTLPQHELW